jgi:hypothetical protein
VSCPGVLCWLVQVCLCMALSCKAFLLKKKRKKRREGQCICPTRQVNLMTYQQGVTSHGIRNRGYDHSPLAALVNRNPHNKALAKTLGPLRSGRACTCIGPVSFWTCRQLIPQQVKDASRACVSIHDEPSDIHDVVLQHMQPCRLAIFIRSGGGWRFDG